VRQEGSQARAWVQAQILLEPKAIKGSLGMEQGVLWIPPPLQRGMGFCWRQLQQQSR
jgi:hypothetical protein